MEDIQWEYITYKNSRGQVRRVKKWDAKKVKRLNDIIRFECQLVGYFYYPFSKELRKEIEWIVSKDKKKICFRDDFMVLKYKVGILNEFYRNLFTPTGFDDLEYIDVPKAITDSDYLKESGKTVTRNFLKLNPHFKDKEKAKKFLSPFISSEYSRIKSIIELNEKDQEFSKLNDENINLNRDYKSVNYELAVAHSIIKRNKSEKFRIEIQEKLPEFIAEFRRNADKSRFKSNGKVNYAKLGRIYNKDHKTAQRWCKRFGIKQQLLQ